MDVLQVCSRLGMTLGFKVLEEGRYCLVWPKSDEQQQLLMAAGEACVVDVYGRGALLTVKEVGEGLGLKQCSLSRVSVSIHICFMMGQPDGRVHGNARTPASHPGLRVTCCLL